MLQIKSIRLKNIDELDPSVNAFLATIPSEAVKEIKVNETTNFVLIQYELVEAYVNALCCDCQYWDDSGDVESTTGLCHECGQRKRFNNKACKCFKDIRG